MHKGRSAKEEGVKKPQGGPYDVTRRVAAVARLLGARVLAVAADVTVLVAVVAERRRLLAIARHVASCGGGSHVWVTKPRKRHRGAPKSEIRTLATGVARSAGSRGSHLYVGFLVESRSTRRGRRSRRKKEVGKGGSRTKGDFGGRHLAHCTARCRFQFQSRGVSATETDSIG